MSWTEKKDTHERHTQKRIYLEDKTELPSKKRRKLDNTFFTSASEKLDFHEKEKKRERKNCNNFETITQIF